jgi:hypothetical protein
MSDDRGRGNVNDAALVFEQVVRAFNGRKVLEKVSSSVTRGETLCIHAFRPRAICIRAQHCTLLHAAGGLGP